MMEAALHSMVGLIFDPLSLLVILLATLCGVFFGIVPGLGGKLAIALFIPVVIGMEPRLGLLFLVAMHAVVHTGGSVPSILLGIPGTTPNVVTILDGYPLTRRGQAGRALGASLLASGIGGVVGAVFLLTMLPVLKPVMLALGPAEFFLLAVMGITFISTVSGASLRKGVIVGCLGLALSCIGLSPQTGEARFVFGQLFLWDGVDFITVVLAMFVVPEMLALGISGNTMTQRTAGTTAYGYRDILSGMADVLRHRWLVLRTSLIGAFIGLIPGLGGDVASWICYGHAAQSSDNPQRFGQGAIEGVIAPETANNSKEGGALLPTLMFGVPGSSGMAVLLGAFLVLGVQPGPQILMSQQPLLLELFSTLVLANLIGVAVLLAISRYLARIAYIPVGIIIPLVLVLALLGSTISALNWQHLLIFLMMGILAYGLKRYKWPRPPFVIGLALGPIAENSLHQALAIWGVNFFLRPVSLVLIGLIVANILVYSWRKSNKEKNATKG